MVRIHSPAQTCYNKDDESHRFPKRPRVLPSLLERHIQWDTGNARVLFFVDRLVITDDREVAVINMEGAIGRQEFERYICDAINALPQTIRDALENVAFVVEEEPKNADLLGLYHGIPRTKRGAGYSMALPDKITIYKRMLEDEAGSAEELPRLVRRVVWHEIGHHFGFGEREIRKLERKWERERKI